MSRTLPILCAAAVVLALAACGKAGSPRPIGDSSYPRFYPPISTGTAAASEAQGTKKGPYIDPSVEGTDNAAMNRVAPGSNLPYSRQQSDSGLGPGLGAPTQSPLPPIPYTLPDPTLDTETPQQ